MASDSADPRVRTIPTYVAVVPHPERPGYQVVIRPCDEKLTLFIARRIARGVLREVLAKNHPVMPTLVDVNGPDDGE